MYDAIYISYLISVWDGDILIGYFVLRIDRRYDDIIKHPHTFYNFYHICLLRELIYESINKKNTDFLDYLNQRWKYFYCETKQLSLKEEQEIAVSQIKSIWTYNNIADLEQFMFLCEHPVCEWVNILLKEKSLVALQKY